MKLELQPVTFAEACEFIRLHHRHHKPPVGHRFSIAVNDGESVVGVIVVGRPVSRNFDDGWTVEVTRCCSDGTKNACSMLYSAAWRTARAMGYKRLVTYTLDTEGGSSLKASNWKLVGAAGGGSWNCKSRPRVDKHPTQGKLLWETTDASV